MEKLIERATILLAFWPEKDACLILANEVPMEEAFLAVKAALILVQDIR